MEEGEEMSSASIEYSLLGLLDERAMHGYELSRELRRKSGLGLVWTVKQSQLYAILSKLEARGLIVAALVTDGPRPAKKVYSLTEAGAAEFARWLSVPAGRKNFRLDFLAKLIAAEKRDAEAASVLVAAQAALCSAWLAEARSRESACPPESLDRLVYRYRIGQLEAMACWLAECAGFGKGGK